MLKVTVWRMPFVFLMALAVSFFPVFTASTAAQADPAQIIFMHHSTGQGLIWQGGVREALTSLGYAFWDHGYNEEGLVDSAGNYLGTNWDVPGDNTDPDGWHAIFNQPVTSPPSNTFSRMLEYDVIVFKSCFPSSDIVSEEQFETYRSYFLDMRDVMDQHPDKLFVPFTTPPLVPNETAPEHAARARRWAEYLTSPEYLDGHPNIFVFDFFSLLADEDGYLRAEYRGDEWDSHPNELANSTVGPIFVDFLDQAIREFSPGTPVIQPETVEVPGQVDDAGDTAGHDDEASVSAVAGDIVQDFEDGDVLADWWDYVESDSVKQFAYEIVSQGYDSDQALRLTFEIEPGATASCGGELLAGPGWADASGLSFYWRADQPDLVVRVALGVNDPARPGPDDATIFEVELETSGSEWSLVTIDWESLTKAEWFTGGVDVFDPTQVLWIAFDVGQWELPQAGSVWIDEIHLATDE
jgi:hypothetical protein